jgi:hypothetical protein
MGDAASIKTSRLTIDTFRTRHARLHTKKLNLRTSFALRYGRIVGDEGSSIAREGAFRSAFNSPYRPFVLASTSIGQEGLDFHPWCHAIVHWNLPDNPVDLEQREGRVHRYKGHAIRKNVCRRIATDALRTDWQPSDDPWTVVLRTAAGICFASSADLVLVPWWIYPGPHKIQRRIANLSFSSEIPRLARLKHDLIAYRLVFGQPRQQELLDLVRTTSLLPEAVSRWTIRLQAPPPSPELQAPPFRTITNAK